MPRLPAASAAAWFGDVAGECDLVHRWQRVERAGRTRRADQPCGPYHRSAEQSGGQSLERLAPRRARGRVPNEIPTRSVTALTDG
jgi:hypothetical protein